ncbi:MAG: type II toxin-antitoxin system HicB family antitoxin [Thermodesulfobacteriota bacterium]
MMNDGVALIWKDGDAFTSCLGGTNLSSCGETREEAFKNLQECIELYFEELPEDEKKETVENALDCSLNDTVEVKPISLPYTEDNS